ncbi:MAG: DMT family transporter [Thermoleophilia bacterium]|nr:DMT family transporter [Thermoleophilia bacterium]
MERRAPLSAYLAAIGMTVAFGLSFVATKYALRGFEPQLIAFIRFALAGGILWSVWRLRPGRERATRSELKQLAALGFVSLTLYFTLEINGIARTSASEAAIIIAAIPIFVSALSAVVLGERAGRLQWAGIVVSFAGVVGLMQLGGDAVGGTLAGNLLVLAAAFTAAVYNLMARRLLVTRSALYVTAFQNLFGALFTLPLALLEMAVVGVRTPTPTSAGAVLYLTLLCSVLAYLLINYAFRFLEASRVAVFVNLTPVVAVVGAYLLLGERLTAAQVAAAVVVIVGVWVTNSGRSAPAKPKAPAPTLRSPSAG